MGLRNRTGSCDTPGAREAPRYETRGRSTEVKLAGIADLGNRDSELLGVGDVVAPDADDLRAISKIGS